MGDVLMKIYKAADEIGGVQMKTRLALKTCIPSAAAASLPDSPEYVEKLKAAFKEIAGKDAPV